MLDQFQLKEKFQSAMDNAGIPFNARLDRCDEVGIGGYRITFTVKPKDAPKVNPFKVGTRFVFRRRTYEVTGQNMRRWKYPVQAKRLPDGKRFCFPSTSVQDGYLFNGDEK
jgi:hypothetical protein